MSDLIDRIKSLDIKQEINNLIELIETFYQNYKETNSQKLRLIDTFVVFSFLVFVCNLFMYFLMD